MNKPLWIILLLPLVAVVGAFLLQPREQPGSQAAASSVSLRPMPQSGTRDESPAAGSSGPSFTEETWRKVDESMKNMGQAMSPQLEAVMADAKISQIETRCAPLFKEWGLSSEMVRETLHVLKEKELSLRRARTQRLRGGVSQMGQGKEGKYIENALAESQLITILGQSHYNQLAAIEKQVESDNVKRGLSLARAAQDD